MLTCRQKNARQEELQYVNKEEPTVGENETDYVDRKKKVYSILTFGWLTVGIERVIDISFDMQRLIFLDNNRLRGGGLDVQPHGKKNTFNLTIGVSSQTHDPKISTKEHLQTVRRIEK